MRNVILLLVTFILITGCTSNSNTQSTNNDQEYKLLISKAKELDEAGKTAEALNTLAKVVIRTEDMDFFASMLDKSSGNVLSSPLVISNKSSKKDGDYMYASGSITNEGTETYTNIKIKVIYTDDNNKVIDTNWTFAVDSVGIKPNETKRFEIMTKYIDGMEKYRFEIL